LHAIWTYFVKKFYAKQNLIEVIEPEEKDPEPIPIDEMFTIVDYIKNGSFPKHHY